MKGGEDHFCFEIHESLGSVSEIRERWGGINSVLKFMKGGEDHFCFEIEKVGGKVIRFQNS